MNPFSSNTLLRLMKFRIHALKKLFGILMFSALPLCNAVAQGDEEPTVEGSLSLWGMIQQGGWAMYPLGMCSLGMLFLMFYAWKETARHKFIPTEVRESGMELLGQFRISEAMELLGRNDTVLSRVMVKSLQRIRADVPEMNRGKAEATLVEHLEAEENAVAQWVNYLNVVGAVAPMIGLLGTVSGMISAFQTIGQGGMGRPELLAGDIGEALITTAAGLVVGIPSMISYFVLRNRLSGVVVETSQLAGDLLDEIPVNVIFEDE